jgi:hypothetical protein
MKTLCLPLVALCGMIFLFRATATTYYVDVNSTNPTPPYAGWSTAATNIQDAIFHSFSGDTVLVTNGIYQYGGASNSGSNRVYVVSPITLQSVNGPAVTVIKGAWDAATNGPNAVRCVYLVNNAVLSGFTLTNGATPTSGSAGGVLCASPSCVVSNCIITGNAGVSGGGVY